MVGFDVMPRTPSGEQFGQLSVLDPVATQVVQPGALAPDGVEVLQSGHRGSPFRRRSGRSCRATSAIAAGQERPRPLHHVVGREPELLHHDRAGADAPKWSIPMASSA